VLYQSLTKLTIEKETFLFNSRQDVCVRVCWNKYLRARTVYGLIYASFSVDFVQQCSLSHQYSPSKHHHVQICLYRYIMCTDICMYYWAYVYLYVYSYVCLYVYLYVYLHLWRLLNSIRMGGGDRSCIRLTGRGEGFDSTLREGRQLVFLFYCNDLIIYCWATLLYLYLLLFVCWLSSLMPHWLVCNHGMNRLCNPLLVIYLSKHHHNYAKGKKLP
jgi:hypothetical protein